MNKLAAVLASAFYDNRGTGNSGCSCLGGIVVIIAFITFIVWLIGDIPKLWELSNAADSSDFSSYYYEEKFGIILMFYMVFIMFPFVGWRMTNIKANKAKKKKASSEISRFLDNHAYAHLACIWPGGLVIFLLRLFLPWWSVFFVIVPILSYPIITAIRRHLRKKNL